MGKCLTRVLLLTVFCVMVWAMFLPAASCKADVIFIHGHLSAAEQDAEQLDCANLRVGIPADSGIPRESHSYVEALAVKDGKVFAVGDTKAMLKLKDRHTSVVDLRGRFVLPGFNDAHLHLASGGFEKLNVNLVGTKSLAEMQERIAERVKTAAPGEWIRGRGWGHTKWNSPTLPTREDLDAVTAGHPGIFTRVDGHICVVNTAALRPAALNKDSVDPPGGKIDRGGRGGPTGILREGARDAVDAVIPKVANSERRKAIELALAEAARWGLTSLQDNSDWQNFLVYEEIEREGKLSVRYRGVAGLYQFPENTGGRTRPSSRKRSDAANRHAQGLSRRVARFAHGGAARALRGRSEELRSSAIRRDDTQPFNAGAASRRIPDRRPRHWRPGCPDGARRVRGRNGKRTRRDFAFVRSAFACRACSGDVVFPDRVLRKISRHRLDATESFTHRHELGRGAARHGAGGQQLRGRWRLAPTIRLNR